MPERRSQGWVEAGWYASPRLLLRPLALLYGLFAGLHRIAYRIGILRSVHAGVPTVVIGNVTVGGTGKTPLTLWLVSRLRQCGRKPGIVLRGYGGRQRAPHLLTPADDALRVGDEAVLLARRSGCPVAVGRDRAAAAQLLAAAGCNVVIADDGLQHHALKRDLEILVIDGARGFGNGSLLPAGPLRERRKPWRRGRVIVVHGVDAQGVVPPSAAPLAMTLTPLALREVRTGQSRSLEELRGATVHAVAGIGHPQRFFDMLRALGAEPIEHPFPDHRRFRAADLTFGDGLRVVMTEKDAVRCTALAAGRNDLFHVPVAAALSDPDGARLLDRVLAIGRS